MTDPAMKLAVVTPSISRNGGGISRVLLNLAKKFHVDSSVTSRQFGLCDEHSAEDLEEWGGLDVELFKRVGPRSLGYSPSLRRRLQAYKPQLVHNHGLWMHTSDTVRRVCEACSTPYLVSPHGMLDPWAVGRSRIKKRVAGLWFEDRHLSQATAVHALCGPEAIAVREFGLRQPIFVIPNAVDLPTQEVVREDVSTERKRQLLFLGRIHPKKGIAELLAGWQRIERQRAGWNLLIAGWDDGGHLEEIQTTISGIGDSVKFVGSVFGDEKDRLLRSVDAFVLPSYSEGLPMTILEAWAYKLPVIMTRFCNLPDGFSERAALEISPNVESIVAGLADFFGKTELQRREMGQNGFELVSSKYTWQTIAMQYLELYRFLLGTGDRPDFEYSL